MTGTAVIPEGSSIRVLSRACAVLRAFSLRRPQLTLGELARELELPKATVHRLVISLAAEGLMAQAADGRYELGFGLISMGEIARRHLALVNACAAALAAIARITDETVLLAQIDWTAAETIIIERIDSPHPLAILSAVGDRSPIYPGCLGRAALAGAGEGVARAALAGRTCPRHTPRTRTDPTDIERAVAQSRQQGYAIDDGEFLEGTSGVAVPVVLVGDRPAGAIGIVGPSTRLSVETLHALGATLRDETPSLRAGDTSRLPA
jgi:DNA-binding IclR family transcriptional regulator